MERTLIQIFTKSVDAFPENPLIWEKKEGQYRPTTYRKALAPVRDLAAGLLDLGLEKGDRVTLFSEGRNEWVFSELGILFAGGVNVPVSVKLLEPSELEFRLKHSDSNSSLFPAGILKESKRSQTRLPVFKKSSLWIKLKPKKRM